MEIEAILNQLGDFIGIFVDSRGRSGGLAILWGSSVSLWFLSSSFNHIDVTIQWSEAESMWRFTGIYGWPKTQHILKMGQMVKDLHSPLSVPWLIGGDLNEVFYNVEKRGPPKFYDSLG